MWNSKPKKRTHNCRKRSRGNPKIGAGICYIGVRPAVIARINTKRLERTWLKAYREGWAEQCDL